MKKFKFKLESVQKVRGLHRKLAERELSVTQARLNKTDQELERTEEAYRHAFRFPAAQVENTAFWFQVANRYQAGLKYRKNELLESKAKLTDRLNAEKKALTRKMRDEMVLDKLEDYQKQEHQRVVDAEEQLEIEELDLLKRGSQK